MTAIESGYPTYAVPDDAEEDAASATRAAAHVSFVPRATSEPNHAGMGFAISPAKTDVKPRIRSCQWDKIMDKVELGQFKDPEGHVMGVVKPLNV